MKCKLGFQLFCKKNKKIPTSSDFFSASEKVPNFDQRGRKFGSGRFLAPKKNLSFWPENNIDIDDVTKCCTIFFFRNKIFIYNFLIFWEREQ